MALPKILDEIEPARVDKHLFVIAQAVKEIEDRIAPRFLGVVAGWK